MIVQDTVLDEVLGNLHDDIVLNTLSWLFFNGSLAITRQHLVSTRLRKVKRPFKLVSRPSLDHFPFSDTSYARSYDFLDEASLARHSWRTFWDRI